MPKRIDYKEGDVVGDKGCIFIKELPPHIAKSYKDRRAIFLCGCRKNYFEASIYRVRNNHTVCQECRRANKNSPSWKLKLKKGDYIDPDHHIRFLEELEPIRKYDKKYRVVKVFDEKYNEEFVARLQDIRSGNTTRGSKGRKERYKEVYNSVKDKLIEKSRESTTKYKAGSTFGSNNEIILLEVIDNKNNKRIGKFYNKITNKTFITSINCVATGQSWGKNISKGEDLIDYLLQESGFVYERQKTFEDCINPKTGYKLRFDFYLPDYNACIEYDGEQHFKYKNNGWNNEENFKKTTERDGIKTKYCKEKNIKLIRIPYTDYDKITKDYLLKIIRS